MKQPEPNPDSGKKILILDDDDFLRDMLEKMIERFGYTPVVAETAEQAVEHCRRSVESGHPFDVALLDVMCPDETDGLEAARTLKTISSDMPLIAMSGFSIAPVHEYPQRYGYIKTLKKPFTLEELRTALTTVFQ